MTDKPIPCVIYGAKSTEDKRGSIPDQLKDGRRLAGARGYEVVAEYQDEAASAYSGDRGPGLARALEHCERLSQAHGGSALIVQHSDRLARGDARAARHLIEVVLWAIKHDVELLSVQDPEILAGGDLALLLGAIGGMRNHQDSKRKSQSVKDGMRRRVTQRGRYTGGRRPFGYEYRDAREDGGGTGPIIPYEPEAAVVRRIFAEYVGGVPQNRIARELMDDGVKTLTGTAWYATTVAGILRNPLYVGRVVLGGESFPGEHDAIIDNETWKLSCQLRRATAESVGRGRGRRTSGQHLLTGGLLRCTCGAAMSPVTKNKSHPGDLYEVYVCLSRLHQGPDACAEPPIKRAAVDGALWAYFERVALDVKSARSIFAAHAARRVEQADAMRQQAESELARAEARLDRITRGWQDEVIDDAEYERQRAELLAQRDAAAAQVEQHTRQRESVSEEISEFDADAAIAEELSEVRQIVAGQVLAGHRDKLDKHRATLRRLFVGFELCSPTKPFGSGALQGQGAVWIENTDPGDDGVLAIDNGYQLLPVVRAESIDLSLTASYDDGFPALTRAAFALHDNFWTRFAA